MAVSGGLDSMVLLSVMCRLATAEKWRLGVVFVHHGDAGVSGIQKAYRDQALELVRAAAARFHLPFFSSHSETFLESEEEMRNFRKKEVEKIRQAQNFEFSVWAHHQQDFVETQVLRLIRGTGPEGLDPMKFLRGFELCPLLKISWVELEEYAQQHALVWLEDPSNQDPKYLRNWLRQTWLPLLEKKCPGALKSMARSLEILRESAEVDLPQDLWLDGGISRSVLMTLSRSQQKQVFVIYLRSRGQWHFTHNHLEELIKYLDVSRKEHTFKLAQMQWYFTCERVFAETPFVVNPE